MTFAKRLFNARNKAGLSQRQLADLLEISVQTYNGYETKGYEPKYEVLLKISYILNVSPNELLGFTEYNKLDRTKVIASMYGFHFADNGEYITIKDYISYDNSKIENNEIDMTYEEFITIFENAISITEDCMKDTKKGLIQKSVETQLKSLYIFILENGNDLKTVSRIQRHDIDVPF